MMRQRRVRLGAPAVLAVTEKETLVVREVLVAKNLRNGKEDPIGSAVDHLLSRYDELESKTAPRSTREVEAMLKIYGHDPKKKASKDSYVSFWLEVQAELKKTLKTPRKIIWGSVAD